MSTIEIIFWLGVGIQCLTLEELLRRRMAKRLFFFSFFVLAMSARNIVLGLNFNTGHYREIQSSTASWMGFIMAAAVVEAFWWLVMELVNFKRYGAWLLAILTALSVGVEWLTSNSNIRYDSALYRLYALERGLGYSLGLLILVGAFGMGLLGTPRLPKWHALSLAILTIGNATAWHFRSTSMLLSSCMIGLTAWCARVTEAPTWESRKPSGERINDEDMRAEWGEMRAGIKRQISQIKSARS